MCFSLVLEVDVRVQLKTVISVAKLSIVNIKKCRNRPFVLKRQKHENKFIFVFKMLFFKKRFIILNSF